MRLVLVSLLLSMPFLSAGDAREQFKQALRHRAQGDRSGRLRADVSYRAVLEIDPEHRAARRALGYRRTSDGWVRAKSEREYAEAALRRTGARTREARAEGVLAILALEARERFRALLVALRSRHRNVRLAVVAALGRSGDKRAIKPLVAHLASAGGTTQRSYIARTAPVAYIQDFDVEVA